MSIMAVTFPAIRDDFPDATAAQLSWINNLFTIVSAAVLIPCGVLADRVGRKRMLLVGAALFTVGSVIGALAPSPAWIMALIAAHFSKAVLNSAACSLFLTRSASVSSVGGFSAKSAAHCHTHERSLPTLGVSFITGVM